MRLMLKNGCRYVSSQDREPDRPLLDLLDRLTARFPDSLIVPGFCDVHVHLREPGFSYKETIRTGTLAAARGGYTDVVTMPNVDPVPDSPARLQQQLDLIGRDAVIGVHPLGAISRAEAGRELADLRGLAGAVPGFSDDGFGVQDRGLMREAMLAARELGRLIVAHCEDERLASGYVHEGEWSRAHGHAGNPSASEWTQLERDLALVRETGCAYHMCHVSSKESVSLLREARAEGLDVTGETCPHYLLLTDEELQDDGRFRMNPPIRSRDDQAALRAGLVDGTLACLTTDHAPHSGAEKAGGLAGSLNGVVGLETAFAMLYTELVIPGLVELETILERLTVGPRRRFAVAQDPLDLSVWQVHEPRPVDPADFLSMGKSSPFAGRPVQISCRATFRGGEIVWAEGRA